MSTISKSKEFVYSAWHFWNVAAEAAQRAKKTRKVHPKAFTSDTINAILLSAMSTEAFINELGSQLSFLDSEDKNDLDKFTSLGHLLGELETGRAQIKSKYLLASNLLPGKPFRRGKQPFQDFSLLVDIRNDFAHPRPEQDPQPKYLKHFSQMKWLYNRPGKEPKVVGWIFRLQTPEIAAWACRVASSIIYDLITRFKKESHPVICDLYDKMNLQWKNSLNDKRVGLVS
jgi:hypothetical protein